MAKTKTKCMQQEGMIHSTKVFHLTMNPLTPQFSQNYIKAIINTPNDLG